MRSAETRLRSAITLDFESNKRNWLKGGPYSAVPSTTGEMALASWRRMTDSCTANRTYPGWVCCREHKPVADDLRNFLESENKEIEIIFLIA